MRVEEGPMWDILRLNTEKCDSIEIDGLRYVVDQSNREPSMDDLERPFVLHPDLARLAGEAALSVRAKRLIPKENLMEARKIMQLVYELYKTEVMVFILYNSVKNEFITMLPKQRVSGGSCTVQAEDSIEGQGKDTIMVADFHSHPFGGHEFLSPIDHGNSTSYASVPIASFNFQTQPRVGGLYAFGKLKAIFGTIPLPQNQFCEEVEEFFTISDADREKWLPLIQAKIDAGRGGPKKTVIWAPQGDTTESKKNTKKQKKSKKVDTSHLVQSLENYAVKSLQGRTYVEGTGLEPEGASILENVEEFIDAHFLDEEQKYTPIAESGEQGFVDILTDVVDYCLYTNELDEKESPHLSCQTRVIAHLFNSSIMDCGDYFDASFAPELFIVALYLFGVSPKSEDDRAALKELLNLVADLDPQQLALDVQPPSEIKGEKNDLLAKEG